MELNFHVSWFHNTWVICFAWLMRCDCDIFSSRLLRVMGVIIFLHMSGIKPLTSRCTLVKWPTCFLTARYTALKFWSDYFNGHQLNNELKLQAIKGRRIFSSETVRKERKKKEKVRQLNHWALQSSDIINTCGKTKLKQLYVQLMDFLLQHNFITHGLFALHGSYFNTVTVKFLAAHHSALFVE